MDDPITGTLYMQKHAFKSRPCKVKKGSSRRRRAGGKRLLYAQSVEKTLEV
ncbi:MAG: hypothetical protein LN416_05480 [Candidatus Thermoplasmatota archaeon]|nr:hypothetical protein [Candidatus Thermoplasmatota archaeon]